MQQDITLQVGVKVLLKNNNGKFLLVRRSKEKYPDVIDSWDIVGGRIIPGTELIENLKREVKEEVGLDLANVPVLIAAQDILRNNGKHIVRLTYIAEVSGDVILDTTENDQYQWLDFDELLKIEDLDHYFKHLLEENIIIKHVGPIKR